MRTPIGGGLLLAALLLSLPAPAQSEGRSTVGIPVATDLGDWDGTWFHVQRDRRAALWLRTGADGKPELLFQYFSLLGDEQFRTDWTGSADYPARGSTGRFALTIREADADLILADWDWNLEFSDSGRSETAKVKIYRSGDGRNLVLLFEDWEQKLRRGTDTRATRVTHTWTFRKASRRELLWDELPF